MSAIFSRMGDTPKPIGTINCLLCGGVQIFPGPRYKNHLINEHGAIFEVEYLIQISVLKRDQGRLPDVPSDSEPSKPSKDENNDAAAPKIQKPQTSEAEIQTDNALNANELCRRCRGPLENGEGSLQEEDMDESDDQYDDVMDRLVMDMEEEDKEINVNISEEEYLARQAKADDEVDDKNKHLVNKRKPVGKDWGPNSFSSTFTCYFCNEQFRKDYRLKLHLMLNHKTEAPEEMAKAKEVLTKAKLDGCVHRCALCGSKYNSVANFTRHIKDVHSITRAQYRAEHGSSEVVSRMFKCELCDKEVKHTRNIIGAHMKMVHLISWKEYQEILIKIRQGETVGDLPAPELFECIICGVSVKYKREHLNKKHQITEDVYDELIAKKSRGEDISGVLPEREIYKCLICDRECMDIKKHIERSHQITADWYRLMSVPAGIS